MAQTTIQTANVVKQWSPKYFAEYVRASKFMAYMGEDTTSVIQVVKDLTKERGDAITLTLIRALNGAGVTGATTLRGNEEQLINYGHQIAIEPIRNGVRINKFERRKPQWEAERAAEAMLSEWSAANLRSHFIQAFMSPALDNTYYTSATEAQKDAWLTANIDRVLCGAVKSNTSSLDHSTSLANIDNTNDKLTPGSLSLAKRMMKAATAGAIRPIRLNDGEEWFVAFAPSLPFRDLKNNSTMQQANREAWTRGRDNPLFTDGDLLWDGIIIREIEEIPVITGVGAGGIDVAPVFMCGAQALGVAWGQMPRKISDEFDYDFEKGVGVEEIRGVEKLYFNNVQHGMLTHYVAAVADS